MKTKSSVVSRLLVVLFLFLLCSVDVFGQDLPENDPDADFGIVYFIRGKGHAGSATAFSALIDGKRVCKLNNRRYSRHEVAPGAHEFSAQFGGKTGKKKAELIQIDIEAGKTYYVQMVMQASFWVNDVRAQEITRNSALHLLEDDEIKLDPKCGEEIE